MGVVMLCFVDLVIDGYLFDWVWGVVVEMLVYYFVVVEKYIVCWLGMKVEFLKV